MRVLILATDIYTRGGIARYTATLAEALSGLPASVDVLPLLVDSRLRGNDGVFNKNDSVFKKNDYPLAAGYRILTPTTDRLTIGAKLRHIIRGLRRGHSRYDLVICSHLSQAPIAAVIRLRYGTPYMVVAHGSEAWGRLPLLKRIAVRSARAILPVSTYTARRMALANRIQPARVSVIHNAISDDMVVRLADTSVGCAGRRRCDASKLVPAGAPMILSVASLKPEHSYKGVDTVIRALPQILAAVPDARYIVAGAGEDREHLEGLASARGVDGHVTFAGEVSDAELVDLYRACHVFVLPSRARHLQAPHEQCHGEGFGRVYVEAALAGKPVVGSSDAGAAEAVLDGRTGLLVDPRSVADVASAVTRLLQSSEWSRALGAEGRRWALERFTVAAMRRALATVLSGDERLVPVRELHPRLRTERRRLATD